MEHIVNTLFYNKPKSNPLVTASLYSFQLLSYMEQKTWDIALALMNDLNTSIQQPLYCTLVSLFCLYTASHVVYHMPSLLDKNMCNGKPTLHVVFGENVAQLVSISLVAEAFQNLSQLPQNSDQANSYLSGLLDSIYREYDTLQTESQVFKNLEHLQASDIANDYQRLKTKLLISAVSAVLLLVGHQQHSIDQVSKQLNEMCLRYHEQTGVPTKLLERLCLQLEIPTDDSRFYRELYNLFIQKK